MKGSHFYKFDRQSLDEIASLRFNGEPIDLSMAAPQHAYGGYNRFLRCEAPLVTLEKVSTKDEGHLERNDRENPFKVDLPASFMSSRDMEKFSIENEIAIMEDGEIVSDPVFKFYEWVPNKIERRTPVDFEVTEIGEITPCPVVDFQWDPVQPFEVDVPCEMWHLCPCQVSKETILNMFWEWVESNKDELCIDSMYPTQKGAHIYFKVGGKSAGMIGVTESSRFNALFNPIQAPSLEALIPFVDLKMESLKEAMKAASPLHTCPRCKGAGALPCRRCEGTGKTDLGERAEQRLKQAVDAVRDLYYASGKKQKEEKFGIALNSVNGLRGFILPENEVDEKPQGDQD